MTRLRSCWRFARTAMLVASLTSIAMPAAFARSQPTQRDVEAAYLYQFGNFVQWPHNTKLDRPTAFSVCVLGQDPFGSVLDKTLSGSKLNDLPMAARRIASVRDANRCDILFISSSRQDNLDADMAALRDTPVLTVSDIPDFVSRGGMIQFLLIDNRVRFEINLSSARRAGLKLSSQLLKVAVAVRGDQKPKY
jgi:hypothetical protein